MVAGVIMFLRIIYEEAPMVISTDLSLWSKPFVTVSHKYKRSFLWPFANKLKKVQNPSKLWVEYCFQKNHNCVNLFSAHF